MNAAAAKRTLLLLAPAMAAMFVIAAFGEVDTISMGAAFVAATTTAILAAHLIGRDYRRLAQHLISLASGRDQPGPDLNADAQAIVSVVQRMARDAQVAMDGATEQRAFDRAILDALSAPVIVVDSRRRIDRLNFAAADLLGPDSVAMELSKKLRAPEVLGAVENAIELGDPIEVEFQSTEAIDRYFIGNVVPLSGEAGGAVIVLHDVSLLKQAEQMRADFVSDISHELRTPLASLIGFIETLQEPARDDTEAQQRFLTIMGEQAGRMQTLVLDLLSLSRIELNERVAPVDMVDICGLVRGAAAALEPQIKKRGVKIRLDLPKDQAIPVIGDADQVSQVFLNLIDNAIKYGGDQSTVTVSLAFVPEGDAGGPRAVEVSVADQGPGIAKEQIPRLTERFYRVDTARSRSLGGTGLGLAIVKHILNRHNGRLGVESEPNQGSTFTVTLPLSLGNGSK